ncbi:B- and T-lymphocyte attenuator-like, partial [Clarias magur]
RVLMLVLFSLSADTRESGSDCIPFIRLPRNTAWRARVTDVLMINCTVVSESHCWENIAVTWCRIDDKNGCRPLIHSNHTSTEWRSVSESERLSVLIFRKISVQDSGFYRCEITSPVASVSHSISVTVTDPVSTQITTAGSPAVTVPVTVKTPLSVEVQFSVIYISVFVVAVVLTAPLIMSRGGKKCQKDE